MIAGPGLHGEPPAPRHGNFFLLARAVVDIAELSRPGVDHRITGTIYFGPTRTLFRDVKQFTGLIHGLCMTIALLLGPKLMALALRLWSTRGSRRFGGRLAMTTSFLVETAFSTLLAPVMMLFHTTFLIRILAGNAVGWPPQARGDRGMDWRQALQRHVGRAVAWWLRTLGAIVPTTCLILRWYWAAAVVPLAVLSSRRAMGWRPAVRLF